MRSRSPSRGVNRTDMHDAGIVDEDVETVRFPIDPGESGRNRLRRGHVALDRGRHPPLARMSAAVSSPAPVSRSSTNTGAPALVKVLANRATNPRPSSGYRRDFPVQPKRTASSEFCAACGSRLLVRNLRDARWVGLIRVGAPALDEARAQRAGRAPFSSVSRSNLRNSPIRSMVKSGSGYFATSFGSLA